MASALIGAVENPVRNQGLTVNPANNSTKELVKLKGPGLFLSAELTKQGGNSDLTFVIIDIDGKNLVNISMAALFNQGLTTANSYGISIFRSAAALETVTIGFPYPLTFNKTFSLKVTVNETGVVQILANVLSAS
jgi:hypothetical protein